MVARVLLLFPIHFCNKLCDFVPCGIGPPAVPELHLEHVKHAVIRGLS
jgi:hypothetical protein